MKLVQSLAALAFGGILVAGCNPKTDDADPAAVDPATEDETMAPAPAPTDMPPPPPTDMPPADPMTPSPTDPAQEPVPEPAPPPNG